MAKEATIGVTNSKYIEAETKLQRTPFELQEQGFQYGKVMARDQVMYKILRTRGIERCHSSQDKYRTSSQDGHRTVPSVAGSTRRECASSAWACVASCRPTPQTRLHAHPRNRNGQPFGALPSATERSAHVRDPGSREVPSSTPATTSLSFNHQLQS